MRPAPNLPDLPRLPGGRAGHGRPHRLLNRGQDVRRDSPGRPGESRFCLGGALDRATGYPYDARHRNMRKLFAWLLAGCALGWTMDAARAQQGFDYRSVNGIQAIVGDAVITFQQVRQFAAAGEEFLVRNYANKPEFRQKQMELINDSLKALVRRQLILQDFNASGFKLPESIIDEIVQDKIKQQYTDRLQFNKYLQRRGITFDTFRKETRDQLVESEMTRKYVPDPIISPHKVELYYQEHLSDFKVGDQVKLRMIKRDQPAGETPGSARRMLQEILTLLKDGAAFGQLAEVYSDGSLRSQGGLTGWQDISAINKPLADAVLKMNPGAYSEIIETPEACYLVLLEDKKAAHNQPLNEVREGIEGRLKRIERQRVDDKWIRRLQTKTWVRYFSAAPAAASDPARPTFQV